jgi:hypothetical protein
MLDTHCALKRSWHDGKVNSSFPFPKPNPGQQTPLVNLFRKYFNYSLTLKSVSSFRFVYVVLRSAYIVDFNLGGGEAK